MDKLNFKDFSNQVEKQFNALTSDENAVIVRANVDGDKLWELYLSAYPEEYNQVFRERPTYDCNHCKSFIRRIGSAVAIKNGKIHTVWDVTVPGYFQEVADKLAEMVRSAPIGGYFLTTENVAGNLSNFDTVDPSIKWDHFYAKIPSKLVFNSSAFGIKKSELEGNFAVFSAGMKDLKLEAAETVLELINQGSLYRGEEHKEKIKDFIKSKKKYDALDDEQKTLFIWSEAHKLGFKSRFKNEVIGTLVADLSEGKDLEKAVQAFETKVAPTNYRRTTALITPSMIKQAQDKIETLGYGAALYRRFAKEQDISINNVMFKAKTKIALNVFDEISAEAKSKPKELKKVESISLDKFVNDVMPNAENIEVLFENRFKSNLVTLVAPEHDTSNNMFKWDNNFSWAYNGDVTDAIKERVKQAGGKVEGDLRISLNWHNGDDLDLHCKTPTDRTIYYARSNRRFDGGELDVDMNGLDQHDDKNPVENIIFADKLRMVEGQYQFMVNQYNRRTAKNGGFSIQVEFDGNIQTFEYPHSMSSGETIKVFTVEYKNGEFKLLNVSDKLTGNGISSNGQEIWNVKTNEFVPAKLVMNSPNFWGENKVGNKHLFFILDNCKTNEPVRGFFNEYLKPELNEHRKVFEVLGGKLKAEPTDDQLSGLGFSETIRNEITVRVTNKTQRVFKVII